ncbi:MAG: hypothetical protein ACRDQ1_16280 [Sciscionella sp.]
MSETQHSNRITAATGLIERGILELIAAHNELASAGMLIQAEIVAKTVRIDDHGDRDVDYTWYPCGDADTASRLGLLRVAQLGLEQATMS